MLTLYFVSLSLWTTITKTIRFFIPTKPLNVAGVLHNVSSVYFLTNDMVTTATVNTLGFYTTDIMHMAFTNYYTHPERYIYFFHHFVSIYFLITHTADTYPITVAMFKDIELSNLALYAYYYLSKFTRNHDVLAFANLVEALVYGYYRIGLIYHYIEHFQVVRTYYFEQILGFWLYYFGAYYTYVLCLSAIQKLRL